MRTPMPPRRILLTLGLGMLLGLAGCGGSSAPPPPAPTPVPAPPKPPTPYPKGYKTPTPTRTPTPLPATATAVAIARATSAAATAVVNGDLVGPYSEAVTTLVTQIQAGDGPVADTIRQAGSGEMVADEAAARVQGYMQAGETYRAQAESLSPPQLYVGHRQRLLDALDARTTALNHATAYVEALRTLPGARQASDDAQTVYLAAQKQADADPSGTNRGAAITAKRQADTAQAEYTRLQTHADQDQQAFVTAWADYQSKLPPVPPPTPQP